MDMSVISTLCCTIPLFTHQFTDSLTHFQGQLVLELGFLDLAGYCVRHASELGMTTSPTGFGGSPTQQAVVQSFLKNYDKVRQTAVLLHRLHSFF